MKLVLDAGALIEIDRGDRRIAGLIALARRSEGELATTAAVVGQVWRGDAPQDRLARLLDIVDVRDVTVADARSAGSLLGRAGTAEVVDALVALLASPGDQVLTSDPDDLRTLLSQRPGPVLVVRA